jgi:hypothetical protein
MIVGLLAAPAASARQRWAGQWRLPAVLGVVACLPDLDFLWGRHNYETHSVGAAVLAGLAVLVGTRGRNWRLAIAVAAAWGTHVLFDWLGSDDSPPIGIMALWPVSSGFYYAGVEWFDPISRQIWRDDFWWQNLIAVLKEIALLAPPVAALAWFRWGRGKRAESGDVVMR